MGTSEKRPAADRLSRRDFLMSSAAAGLGVALTRTGFGQAPPQAAPAPAAKSFLTVSGCPDPSMKPSRPRPRRCG